MDAKLLEILTNLHHLQAISLVLTAGLFGYAIYATVVLARILKEIRGPRGLTLCPAGRKDDAMALMMVEVYDALLDAGASEEKARKAATEIAAYDNRLASVERKLDHITIELRLYAGLLTTIGLGILWRVWH